MMNNKTKVECYRIICNYLKICSASLLYGFAEFTKFITRLVCSALSAHMTSHIHLMKEIFWLSVK